MDEQLRLGELELSLERARIARQLTQLEQTRQVIERNARQLGFTVNAAERSRATRATREKVQVPVAGWVCLDSASSSRIAGSAKRPCET